MIGGDAALRDFQGGFRAGGKAENLAALMDADTCGGGGLCQPDGEVQRVEVARAMVKRATGKAVRPDQAADACAVKDLGLRVIVVAGEVVSIGARVVNLAGGVAGVGDTGAEGDRHLVAGDQVADEGFCILGHVPQAAGVVHAHRFLDPVLILPLAAADLPAVATRCTKAQAVGFQHHDAQALFGKVQGCRQTHVASPDHGYIGPHLARQGGERVKCCAGRGVIAGGVFALPVIGVQKVQGHQTFRRRCSRSHGLMTCRNSLYSLRFTES